MPFLNKNLSAEAPWSLWSVSLPWQLKDQVRSRRFWCWRGSISTQSKLNHHSGEFHASNTASIKAVPKIVISYRSIKNPQKSSVSVIQQSCPWCPSWCFQWFYWTDPLWEWCKSTPGCLRYWENKHKPFLDGTSTSRTCTYTPNTEFDILQKMLFIEK